MTNKKDKIKHLITLKGTWIIIISQLIIIIQSLGIFDETFIEQFKLITTSLLEITTVLGIVHVYDTEPKKDDD